MPQKRFVSVMKSPTDLAAKLARQWQNADTREQRLLKADSWPLELAIGKPTGRALITQFDRVRAHVNQWRSVTMGRVHWEPHRFRSASEPVQVPVIWELSSPSEWVEASASSDILREYQALSRLVAASDARFHRLLVRKRSLVLDKPEDDVVRATELALQLEPGCAEGKPLRALSLAGIDSKFFERNRNLVVQLLNIRFDGQASDLGLEAFLGAQDEGHHWLLMADLAGDLLPFSQLRVRASELMRTVLPARQILVVENERCLHQLPALPDTIAILGAGLNLSWLNASWLRQKNLAYWGDIDTWGLTMLARARQFQPGLTPLLMTETIFEAYQRTKAVVEPQPAEQLPAQGLAMEEQQLYTRLLGLGKGRLEQEFLPSDVVEKAILQWFRAAT